MDRGGDETGGARGRRAVLALALLLLPFALFAWQLPFVAERTIGCDYTLFPGRQQQELLFSIRMGSYPLFVPGFAGGHTASALTLGQLHHPLSWLSALCPGYWDGLALEWNTFWRLASLGATHLVLFHLLRALGLGTGFAALLGGLAVYNLRMLDWFRFGASLEGYTAFLLASAAAVWRWLRPGRPGPSIGLVAASYCLVVSGHPQVMYYGLFGLGLVLLFTPWLPSALDGGPAPGLGRALRFQLASGALVGLGVLLAAVYVLPFAVDFLGDNSQRVGRDYAWADHLQDTLVGTLQSFFLPLRASVVGSFGGSPLFLVAALTPLLVLFGARIPGVVWALWATSLFAFAHQQGGRTPVHELFWSTMPFAGAFRIAGRIATLQPLVLVLLLAWQVRAPALRPGPWARRIELAPIVPLAALALVATAVWWLLPAATFHARPACTPFEIPEWTHGAAWGLALAALSGLLAATAGRPGRVRAGAGWALLLAATVGELAVVLRHGTWVEERVPSVGFAELRLQRREQLGYSGDPGNGLYPAALAEHMQHAPPEPFLARLCEHRVAVADPAEAYERLSEDHGPWTVVVVDPARAAAASAPAPAWDGGARPIAGSEVELARATFNRLDLRVRATADATLLVNLPWSVRWSATVDGRREPLRRANGAYLGLPLAAGERLVELRYQSPAAELGAAVSLGLLALLLVVLVRLRWRGRAPLVLALLGALAIGPGGWLCWRASLWSGTALETRYRWRAPATRPGEQNLAYGRPAWLSSLRGPQFAHALGGYGAVDGFLGPGAGALTRTEDTPRWIVDLGRPRPLRELVLHEGGPVLAHRSVRFADDPWNERPLLVQASDDYQRWRTVGVLRGGPAGEPRRVPLEGPLEARFLRIVGNRTRLALREVEVH